MMNNTNESAYKLICEETLIEMNMTDTSKTVSQTVYELFEKQVADQAPKKLGKLATDSPLDDIGMDSLEALSVAMDLEECYGLFIPDEDVMAFVTIQDVVNYLEAAVAAKPVESRKLGDSGHAKS